MEFNANRGGRQPQPNANVNPAQPAGSGQDGPTVGSSQKSSAKNSKVSGVFNMKFASIVLLFSVTILIVSLLFYLVLGTPRNENDFTEKDKYQAVFLNGGQVYFGKATDLNDKYLRLVDIYYLRVNQQVQPSEEGQDPINATGEDDISLVKLGCELHGPKDEMLINRDQLVFWENLKSDGQVAEAIADYKTENPEGQDCDAPAQEGAAPNQEGAPEQQQIPAPLPEEGDAEDGNTP